MLVVLVVPLCFWNLDVLPLRIWDESRLAMNSLEMLNNGNWVTTFFDGKPDMWNTKPPLLIWAQVATMKLIGPSDFAVRLPSVVAALLTFLSLFILARNYLRSTAIAVMAILVLATSPGFMNWHGVGAADYDAAVTLWTTLACLGFYLYTETTRARYLYLFFLSLAMGVLTKSVGALLFLPGLFLFALWKKKIPAFLSNKHFYISLGTMLLLVGGYYALREHHNPGYLSTVCKNELGGRYLQAIEGHGESPFFFLTNLWQTRMPFWVLFVPLGMATGFFRRQKPLARFTHFLTLLVLGFFLVITIGQTKCRWYDMPMYPFMALLVAIFFFVVITHILNFRFLINRTKFQILPILLLVFLFAGPYRDAIQHVRHPENQTGYYYMGYVLKESLAGQRELDGMRILINGYSPQNDFYIRLLQMRGKDVKRADWKTLVAGDLVITTDGKIAEGLVTAFDCKLVDETRWLKTYEILGSLSP